MTRRSSLVAVLAVLLALAVVACSRATPGPPGAVSAAPSRSPVDAAEDSPSEPAGSPSERAAGPTTPATAPPHPVSLAAYFDQAELTGGGLRLGTVRERTAAYTSYDVTFASDRRRARRRCASAGCSTSRTVAGRSPRWCSPTATSTPAIYVPARA